MKSNDTTPTPTPTFDDATSDEILAEIARQGERRHVIWQLTADGRDYCGIDFVADEFGIRNRPLAEVVETFIDDVDLFLEYESEAVGTDGGIDAFEAQYGERANGIIIEAWAR